MVTYLYNQGTKKCVAKTILIKKLYNIAHKVLTAHTHERKWLKVKDKVNNAV